MLNERYFKVSGSQGLRVTRAILRKRWDRERTRHAVYMYICCFFLTGCREWQLLQMQKERSFLANCKLANATERMRQSECARKPTNPTAKKLGASRREQELAQGGTRGLSRKIIACFAGPGEILRSNLPRRDAGLIRALRLSLENRGSHLSPNADVARLEFHPQIYASFLIICIDFSFFFDLLFSLRQCTIYLLRRNRRVSENWLKSF